MLLVLHFKPMAVLRRQVEICSTYIKPPKPKPGAVHTSTGTSVDSLRQVTGGIWEIGERGAGGIGRSW